MSSGGLSICVHSNFICLLLTITRICRLMVLMESSNQILNTNEKKKSKLIGFHFSAKIRLIIILARHSFPLVCVCFYLVSSHIIGYREKKNMILTFTFSTVRIAVKDLNT